MRHRMQLRLAPCAQCRPAPSPLTHLLALSVDTSPGNPRLLRHCGTKLPLAHIVL
jgi:hypothetical protein